MTSDIQQSLHIYHPYCISTIHPQSPAKKPNVNSTIIPNADPTTSFTYFQFSKQIKKIKTKINSDHGNTLKNN